MAAKPRLWLLTDVRYTEVYTAHTLLAFAHTAGDSGAIILRAPLADALELEVANAVQCSGTLLLKKAELEHTSSLKSVGIHLGSAALLATNPGALLERVYSAACHDERELELALALAVSAIVASPVFDVPGKADARGTGWLSKLRARISATTGAPQLIALGGIEPSRVQSCLDAGADGVAVMRALFETDSTERATTEFLTALRNHG